MAVTIDNGLKVGEGEQSAEVQIETLLASPRANYKLALDMGEDYNQYFAMAEEYLWPSGKDKSSHAVEGHPESREESLGVALDAGFWRYGYSEG